MRSHNLATCSDAERLAVDADQIACLIRWEVRDLKGQERQRMAKLLLSKQPEKRRTMIEAALLRRANGKG